MNNPTDGEYKWDEKNRTMSSSVFGDPASPEMPKEVLTPLTDLKDVRLGITFEDDGLRAKTIIERKD